MKLYRIPIYKRVVNVAKNESFPKKEDVLRVGAIGIYLLYDEENQKDISFIRKNFVRRVIMSHCILEAMDPKEAIKKFHTEYEGARIGGNRRKEKAMWINEKEYIFEFPHCELLHRNKEEEFICGNLSEESDGEQGEWGMCVLLEGYDGPENCIISEFYENWRHTSTIANIGGFKVVQPIKCCYS